MDATFKTLRDNELFRDLTTDELRRLQVDVREVQFEIGDKVFGQGQSATAVYFVASGLIALRKELMAPVEIPPADSSITLCGPGEMIGWSALVPPSRYTLTAITKMPTTLLVVEGQALLAAMERRPAIGFKLMRSLAEVVSRRLRQIEVALVVQRAYVIMDSPPSLLTPTAATAPNPRD